MEVDFLHVADIWVVGRAGVVSAVLIVVLLCFVAVGVGVLGVINGRVKYWLLANVGVVLDLVIEDFSL